MEVVLTFLLLVVFLIVRVPIAFSIGLASLAYIVWTGELPLSSLPVIAFQSLDSFPLMAIPFFLLAGNLMARGGIARRLLNVADELLGSLYGGFALATILACTFFADLSGSGPATVAAIGTIMIPAMIERGYAPAFASAVAASAGCLGVIIPPSVPMITYSVAGGASIGRLFLAGFIPGIMLAFSLCVPAYFISRKKGWRGTDKKRSLKRLAFTLWDAKWAALVPVIILGGIYGGIFTPTESAAVACAYAVIIGLFVYKDFTVRELPEILLTSARIVCTLLIILAMATIFGQILTLLQVPSKMALFVTSLTDSPILIMLFINIFLLFVGTFMEANAAIILLTPLLLPIATKIGFDPVHFGIIMIINLAIGFMTPPLGVNLFVANAISGEKCERIFIASIPLVIGMLVVLALICAVPWFTLVLPNLYYK